MAGSKGTFAEYVRDEYDMDEGALSDKARARMRARYDDDDEDDDLDAAARTFGSYLQASWGLTARDFLHQSPTARSKIQAAYLREDSQRCAEISALCAFHGMPVCDFVDTDDSVKRELLADTAILCGSSVSDVEAIIDGLISACGARGVPPGAYAGRLIDETDPDWRKGGGAQ
jgi:hypothetical protein